MDCVGIILAAGMSSRMKGTNKQLLSLGGIPVIIRSALNFERCGEVSGIIIAARAEDIKEIEELCRQYNVKKLKAVCEGGESRAESAMKAYSFIEDCDVVAVHDGARPFATPELISRVIRDAYEKGGAIAAVPVKDTIKAVSDGFIEDTPDRDKLYAAQTPQAFQKAIYGDMLRLGGDVTDDSQLMERLGKKVKITLGSYDNIKITTPEDIALGESIIKRYDEC